MTFRPINTLETPLPENVSFSEDYKQFLEQITRYYRDIARTVNDKERGFYPEELEILNSQKYFVAGDPQRYRNVFRKVFSFGAIAAGAVLNIAHGITGLTEVTDLYGAVITAVPDDRPIPYVDTVLVTNQISVLRNGINIVVTNGATAPNVTSGTIVIEYLKQ